ncbi:MAG: hypothetical protein AAF850_09885 [Pseudomonadota bacterium]
MRDFKSWVLLSAALAMGACASNKPSPPGGRGAGEFDNAILAKPIALFFASLDQDVDGQVTQADIEQSTPAVFTRFDRNTDGQLTPIEFANWSETHLGDREALPGFLRFDRDRNDAISLSEFQTTLGLQLDRLDEDKDGAVSVEEMTFRIQRPQRNGDQEGQRRRPAGARRRGPR